MTRSILIADDVPTHRILLKVKLGAACYKVTLAGSGAEALAAMRRERPDLVLLDHGLRDGQGRALCRAIRADPALAEVPVIAFAADHAHSLDALEDGADDALLRPIDDRVLMARIRNLLRARDRMTPAAQGSEGLESLGLAEPAAGFERPARVGLVAARPETAMRWKAALAPCLGAACTVMRWEDALADTPQSPDLFLIAAELDDKTTGLQLMSDLRSRPSSRDCAVCLVLPECGGAETAIALDLGADDVLREGFGGPEAAIRAGRLIARKRRLDRLRNRVEEGLRLAVTDPLTGLWNRRYALPRLGRMMAEHRRGAVMVLDLDHFKAVNDRHGHAAGDAVLVEAAARLRGALAPGDLIARLGGEEFLIALPDACPQTARETADRLRAALSARPIAVPESGIALHVTMSVGLVLIGEGAEAVEQLIDRADRAMLAAKAGGRDRVAQVAARMM